MEGCGILPAPSEPHSGMLTEGSESPSAWHDALGLARSFPARRRAMLLIVAIGTAAALAETVSLGLAVLLLFSLLGERGGIEEAGGLLGRLYELLEVVFGPRPEVLALAFAALILIAAALAYANNAIAGVMANRVAARMRELVHERYLREPYARMERYDHGALMHTLADETWSVSEAFTALARIAVSCCAAAVFTVGLFILAWPIGIAALFGIGVAFAALRLIARPVRRLGARTLAANQVLAERMLASLHGMRTLRVFALEDRMARAFEEASEKVRRLASRQELVKAASGPLNQLMGIGILVLVAFVAGRASIDAPTTFAAVLLLFRLQPYLQEIEYQRITLAGLAAALREVRAMIELPPRARPRIPPGPAAPRGATAPFQGLRDEVRFQEVSFAHDPERGADVEGLDFTIRAGRTLALVGPSGSGKTTILNLLLRLYEPDRGRITVDGRDLASIPRPDWLGHVAVAGQDVELIEGTVIQNLRLARPEASPEALREACRMAEILDDLDALPEGLETRIGARGLRFSGGQRQRIGLARALLRDPDLLLLDEAMSALEPDREERLRRRIAERMAGRTVIVVSHRPSMQELADDVVRIQGGRLVGVDARRPG